MEVEGMREEGKGRKQKEPNQKILIGPLPLFDHESALPGLCPPASKPGYVPVRYVNAVCSDGFCTRRSIIGKINFSRDFKFQIILLGVQDMSHSKDGRTCGFRLLHDVDFTSSSYLNAFGKLVLFIYLTNSYSFSVTHEVDWLLLYFLIHQTYI